MLGVLASALFGAVPVAGAEDPPPFEGGMSFPAIRDPAGPEEFSWRLTLGAEQEAVQVDGRRIEVVYSDGDHVALAIEAPAAHDVEGVSVPTTIALSGADVVVLTVHHRAGNPLAAGAPFSYPVVAGVGWEGGFSTHPIQMPPALQPPATPVPTCVVPKLAGRTLAGSRARLARAGCALGAVRGQRGVGVRVVKQFRARGSSLPAGARVAIKLG